MGNDLTIRMLSPAEPLVQALPDAIRFEYTSDYFYDVEYRETPAGFSWSLIRRPASPPIRRESKWRPFEQHTLRPRGYIALSGDAPVGYAEFENQEWNRLIRVWHFYVRDSERRTGIGMALMAEIEQAARHFKARGIILETQTSNAPAITFYSKMGFEPWGLNTAHYSNNDVANRDVLLWMGKRLAV
jgi:GNAT superfamily N-acetyltransferase